MFHAGIQYRDLLTNEARIVPNALYALADPEQQEICWIAVHSEGEHTLARAEAMAEQYCLKDATLLAEMEKAATAIRAANDQSERLSTQYGIWRNTVVRLQAYATRCGVGLGDAEALLAYVTVFNCGPIAPKPSDRPTNAVSMTMDWICALGNAPKDAEFLLESIGGADLRESLAKEALKLGRTIVARKNPSEKPLCTVMLGNGIEIPYHEQGVAADSATEALAKLP